MWKKIIIDNEITKYSVSKLGQIRNDQTNYILSGTIKKNGYVEYCLYLSNKEKYVLGHILVAQAFLNNPMNYPEVNHLDGNKENNNVDNLEWSSYSGNNQHAWTNNLNKPHILRPVEQYDMHNNYIKTFNSIAEAVKSTGATKIREVANGNRKSSGGYIWKWVEEFIPEDRGKAKKVAQLDDEENIIAIFNSVSEASRLTGANRKGISAVCLGQQKKCYNYKWKFLNDDIVQ